jgi:hypothetical protein
LKININFNITTINKRKDLYSQIHNFPLETNLIKEIINLDEKNNNIINEELNNSFEKFGDFFTNLISYDILQENIMNNNNNIVNISKINNNNNNNIDDDKIKVNINNNKEKEDEEERIKKQKNEELERIKKGNYLTK